MKRHRGPIPFLQVLCVCLLFSAQITTAEIIKQHGPSSEDKVVIYQKYLGLDNKIKSLISEGMKSVFSQFMEAGEHVNVSSRCARNLFTLLNGIRNLNLWAFSIFDASGKLPDGLLSGNVHMVGDFDQCLATKVHKKNGQLAFQGQYCLVKFSPVMPKIEQKLTLKDGPKEFLNAISNASEVMRLFVEKTALVGLYPGSYGLCVPTGCSREEIEQIVGYLSEQILVNTHVESCQVEGVLPEKYRRGQIIIACLVSALGLFCILCSVLEYYLKRKKSSAKSTLTDFLLCFSVTRNFQKIMTAKTQDDSLSCLHGIKALSVFYVIIGHQFLGFALSNSTRHIIHLLDWSQTFFAQIILNATLVVDVFFLIGGLLHSYVRVTRTDENNEPGFLTIIFFRCLRLYPGLIFSILMVFLFMSRGPQVDLLQEVFVGNCEKYWWHNILFITNFIYYEKMCLPQTWYLCVDFQIFLVALFTVSLFTRNPKIAIIVNAALMVAGIVTTVICTWVLNAPSSPVLYTADIEAMETFGMNYNLPLPHIAPYFAGVLIGYFLASKKNIKIPMKWQVIGWTLAGLTYSSTYYVSYLFNTGVEFTRLGNAFYFAFSRLLYPLSVGWMIVCCTTGNGGIINYILSLKLWVPISRIAYLLYLMGPVVQIFFFSNNRSPIDVAYMNLIWHHFGDLVVCCLVGLFATLLSESPIIGVSKLLFERMMESKEAPQDKGVKNGAVKEHIQIWNVPEINTEDITRNGVIKEQIHL